MAEATISKLKFTISANTTSARKNLEKLTATVKEATANVDRMRESFNGMEGDVYSVVRNLKQQMSDLRKTVGELSRAEEQRKKREADQAAAAAKKAEEEERAAKAAMDRAEAEEETVTAMSQTADFADEEASASERGLEIREKMRDVIKQTTAALGEGLVAASSGWDKVIGKGDNIFDTAMLTGGNLASKLASDFGAFASHFESLQGASRVLNGMAKIFQNLTRYAGQFANTFIGIGRAMGGYLTKNIRAFGDALSGLFNTIARRALMMGVRSAIKAVVAGVQEGINNLYQWSLAVDQTFANAMNNIATSTQYLKNSLGAAFAPAIEALAPVIDYIIDKFVSLLNVINQVIAILGGRAYWTKAIKQQASFADAASGGAGKVGDAAKSAKKAIDLYLASFDELHVMNKPSDSGSGGSGGSGGGGGAGGTDYSTMFENVPFDQTLKDLIDNNKWFEVGELFADKMNVITEKLDNWITDVFEPWGIKWANNIGNLINGFFSRYNWDLLGKTIADGMNAAVRIANEFFETTDFTLIGQSIGRAVRSWFDNVSWQEVAEYFANKINAVIDMAYGFITKIFEGKNAQNIGTTLSNAVKTWFDRVDWGRAGETLRTGFNGAVQSLSTFISNGSMWKSIETSLKKLFKKIDGMDVSGLASNLSTLFIKAMDSMSLSGGWSTIGAKIGEFLGGLDWAGIIESVLNASWEMISAGVRGFMNGGNGTALVGSLGAIIGGVLVTKGIMKIISSYLVGKGLQLAGINVAIEGGVAVVGGGLAKKSLAAGILGWLKGSLGSAASWLATTGAGLAGLTLTIPIAIAMSFGKAGEGERQTAKQLKEMSDEQWNEMFPGIPRYIGKETGANVDLNLNAEIDVTANMKTLNDKIPTKQKNVNMTARLDKKTELFDHNTKSMTAQITRKTDEKLNNRTISNMKAEFSKRGLSGNFDPTIYGMKAEFSRRGLGGNFDSTIYGMKARLDHRDINFDKTAYDMKAKLERREIAFDTTVYMKAKVTNHNVDVYFSANGGVYTSGGWKSIQRFATGGVPDGGQMFVAREAGPELVGTLGSHTAVMNNDQIVASVSDGVARAVASVMAGNNGGSNTIILNYDGKTLFKAIVDQNNQQYQRTGNSPLMI